MKRIILFSILALGMSMLSHAQTMSSQMEKAIRICTNLSNGIGASTTAQLKAANKELKTTGIRDFGDLWLEKGKELSVDGHFIFDEEFVDSLIVNRKVLDFSSRYATRRASRGSNPNGSIKMTTKALKAGQSAVWKTVNRRDAEYAIVAEPDGLFTMTIRDDKGKVLYTETEKNKTGAAVRKVRMQLPDKATRLHIEVKNNGKKDASFALIGN